MAWKRCGSSLLARVKILKNRVYRIGWRCSKSTQWNGTKGLKLPKRKCGLYSGCRRLGAQSLINIVSAFLRGDFGIFTKERLKSTPCSCFNIALPVIEASNSSVITMKRKAYKRGPQRLGLSDIFNPKPELTTYYHRIKQHVEQRISLHIFWSIYQY